VSTRPSPELDTPDHHRAPGALRNSAVENGRVSDAASMGIVDCSSSATLAEMGRLLASHHIHSLVIWLTGGERWRVVADVDVAFAALSRPDALADELARPAPSIHESAPLPEAIRLMEEKHVSHLIVTDSASERPVGILSALDVARVVGWGGA